MIPDYIEEAASLLASIAPPWASTSTFTPVSALIVDSSLFIMAEETSIVSDFSEDIIAEETSIFSDEASSFFMTEDTSDFSDTAEESCIMAEESVVEDELPSSAFFMSVVTVNWQAERSINEPKRTAVFFINTEGKRYAQKGTLSRMLHATKKAGSS